MNNRKRAKKREAERVMRLAVPNLAICPNCKTPGAHFVPPSFGEKGFYVCRTPAQGGHE